MAFVLALGGALLATSLWNVWQTDPGFQVAGTLFLDVRFTARIEPRVAVTRVFDLLEDLRRVDGVQAVAAVDTLFMSSASRGSPFRAPAGSATNQEPELLPVTPGYFDVANLRILAGRIPTDAELRTGDGLAVVSARAAQHFWPGISPLGQRLESDRGNVTVIGVVADGRYQKLDRESTGEIYAPLSMGLFGSVVPTFFIRTVGPGQRVMPGLIETVRRFDPTLQVRRAESVSWAMGETVKRRSFQAWLFGAFGAAGIVVAASGVFGMTAMSTRRRTREMGVRLAIGATPVRVVGLIMREQMLTVATGLIVGATIAAMAARYVAALLYGVPPFDPRVWIAAVLIIIVTAISGTLAPALWAARVDPARALRAE